MAHQDGTEEQGISGPGRFIGTEAALDEIERLIAACVPGAYMRFGDGDLNLAQGEADQLQTPSPLFAQEMQEALRVTGPGVMTCLPLHSPRFGMEPGMEPGRHAADDEWAMRIWEAARPFLGQTRTIYSTVALHHCAVLNRPRALSFLKFLREQEPTYVGNREVPADVLDTLFGPGPRVLTPSRESYREIDRVEEELLGILDPGRYTVVVTAMGCASRVLQKRLLSRHADVFLFDFGSLLDALNGWNTRAWIEMSPDLTDILEELRD